MGWVKLGLQAKLITWSCWSDSSLPGGVVYIKAWAWGAESRAQNDGGGTDS